MYKVLEVKLFLPCHLQLQSCESFVAIYKLVSKIKGEFKIYYAVSKNETCLRVTVEQN